MVGGSCSGCDILCLLIWQAAFFIHSSMRSLRGCLEWDLIGAVWDTPGIVVVVESLSHLWLFVTPGLQHNRLPCPLLSPGVCSNSCPLSQWCHLTISSSPGIAEVKSLEMYNAIYMWSSGFCFKVRVGPWHAAALLREEGQSPASPCCSFPISCLFPLLSIPFLTSFLLCLPSSFFPPVSSLRPWVSTDACGYCLLD